MPEEIIVRHEIDLGQLERFEKALKEFKDTGSVKEIVTELQKAVNYKKESNKESQKEDGIVGDLLNKYKELRQAQKFATTEKELKDINKQLRETQKELKKAKDTTTGWSKALGSFAFKFNTLANIASNVVSGLQKGLNRALRDSLGIIRDFESAMAGVKAISGATDAEFKKLKNDAIRLGGATIFTASQVAELQMNYAKLGFSTQEILNATEATLSLAAATDEGLAESALVAGSTLRAFQLDAIETKRVVDVMAKSFTSSAMTLEHWRESMKFSASIAQGAGLSIEATAAAFSVLADAGIKGSIAGTSMKNILIRMSDASSTLSKTIGFAVRDSDDFARALKVLNERGTDLTEVFQLTDRRAAPALRILIEMTEQYEEMAEAMWNAKGAADDMAETRMDTLKGSLTILRSAWEGVVLAFEEGHGILTVHLRSIVDWLTRILQKVKELMLDEEEAAEAWGMEKASTQLQEFDSNLEEGTDTVKAYEEEIARAKEELDKALVKQGQVNAMLPKTEKELTKAQKAWRAVGKAVETVTGALGPSQEMIGATNEDVLESKKNADRAAAAWRYYTDELQRALLQEKLRQEFEKAGIDYELGVEAVRARYRQEFQAAEAKATADFLEEKNRIYREQYNQRNELVEEADKKMRLIILQAQKKLSEDLLYWADSQEMVDFYTQSIRKINAEIEALGFEEIEAPEIEFFDVDKANKEAKALMDIIRKTSENRVEIGYEIAKREIALSEGTDEEITKLKTDAANERTRALLEIELDYLEGLKIIGGEETDLIQSQIDLIKQKLLSIGVDLEKQSDSESGLWVTWYREIGKATNYVIGVLSDLNNTEQQIYEERVRRYDTEIAELQRKLDNEYALQRAGLANRVNIMEDELAAQEKARQKALRDKEKAIKREKDLNTLLQISNLAVTATDILKKAQEQGGVWGWLIGIVSVAAMLLAFATSLSDIESSVYEEGGWVEGKPHSRGGKWINAEGGEFIIRKNVAHKYPDLIESLNKDDIHSVWNDLNMDLNRDNMPAIMLNQEKTESLLGRLVELNEGVPRDIGDGHITFKMNGVTYRIKKNG